MCSFYDKLFFKNIIKNIIKFNSKLTLFTVTVIEIAVVLLTVQSQQCVTNASLGLLIIENWQKIHEYSHSWYKQTT